MLIVLILVAQLLQLNELQNYGLGKRMFKLHNNETPLFRIEKYQRIRDRNRCSTRLSAKHHYLIAVRQGKQDQNSFVYIGLKIWNSIPITITNKTFPQFQTFARITC